MWTQECTEGKPWGRPRPCERSRGSNWLLVPREFEAASRYEQEKDDTEGGVGVGSWLGVERVVKRLRMS